MTDRAISQVDRFVLPAALRAEVLQHLARCAPNEGVGLIGAHAPEMTEYGVISRAAVFLPGVNIEQSPLHYTMDPMEVIRAFRQFAQQGLQLGAIVHSHLTSPASPSPSDLREWNYPESIMMIASFAVQPPALNAFGIIQRASQASVVPIELIDAPADPPSGNVSGER